MSRVKDPENLFSSQSSQKNHNRHFCKEDKVNGVDTSVEVSRFHEAITKNNLHLVRKYLEEGISPNVQNLSNGKLPLIEATNLGHLSIVKALLSAHADVNLTNIQGTTALHVCVNPKVFNKEIVQLYLERRDANFNIQDKITGSTPLHILARVCTTVKTVPPYILHNILREMVNRCDLNVKDKLENTPLHIMAMGKREDVEAIYILLAEKPDVNAKNYLGEVPIATALVAGNFNLALAILDRNVDVNITDKCKYTLLHYAAKKNAAEVATKLLEKGCDGNAQDLYGDTPLHIAAGRGFLETVRELLKHPTIQKNIQNKGGYTPLMCAVDSGFFKVVEAMIEAKCEIGVKSPATKKSALDFAREQKIKRRRSDIYEFLLKKNVEKKR